MQRRRKKKSRAEAHGPEKLRVRRGLMDGEDGRVSSSRSAQSRRTARVHINRVCISIAGACLGWRFTATVYDLINSSRKERYSVSFKILLLIWPVSSMTYDIPIKRITNKGFPPYIHTV